MMRINDAFLNSGLPQYNDKSNLTRDDIKIIKDTINWFINYYKDSYLKSDSYKTIKNYVNNYCIDCRWYSLIIK